jgi:transposase
MFPGIDIAPERHLLARLDTAGRPIGKPILITEDHDGYDTLLKALGLAPALVAMEATGHYWKNIFAALAAAGHGVALLNPFVTRRF